MVRHRWTVAMAVVLGLSACGGTSSEGPASAGEHTEVTLQLKWVHQAQFAGYYLAAAEGVYAEAGLEVSFVPGGPEVDEIGAVGTLAHFGVTSPEELLTARAGGRDLVAVAAIIQDNPVVLVAREGSGITSPEDFAGRTLALDEQATVQYRTVMANLGLDAAAATLVPYELDHAAFLDGKVDVTFAYATGGLVRLEQHGLDLVTIWPRDYGVQVYADVLVTTPELIQEQPDLVRRFVDASLEGWVAAVERPDEAVVVTMPHTSGSDLDTQTRMMDASLPLIHTGRNPVGWMDSQVWSAMADMLVAQGVVAGPIDAEQAYTTTFLATQP